MCLVGANSNNNNHNIVIQLHDCSILFAWFFSCRQIDTLLLSRDSSPDQD